MNTDNELSTCGSDDSDDDDDICELKMLRPDIRNFPLLIE